MKTIDKSAEAEAAAALLKLKQKEQVCKGTTLKKTLQSGAHTDNFYSRKLKRRRGSSSKGCLTRNLGRYLKLA
jgi:hypothetical protein